MSLTLPDWPPKQQYIGKPSRTQINQTNTTQTERTQQVAGAGSVLPVIYGRVRKAGKVVAVGVDDVAGVPVLVVSIVWGAGQIDAIEAVYINGELMPNDFGEGYNRHQDIQLKHYLGTTSQGVDPWLASAISGYADTNIFTVNGQQLGASYSVLSIPSTHRLGGEFPRVEVVARGVQVFDPRQNLVLYSNDVSNSVWSKGCDPSFSVSSNGAGPYGGMAQDITHSASPSSVACVHQLVGAYIREQTIGVIVKQGTAVGFGLGFFDGYFVQRAWFEWVGGVPVYHHSDGQIVSNAVNSLWDGYWVISVSAAVNMADIGRPRRCVFYCGLIDNHAANDSVTVAGIVVSDTDIYMGYVETAGVSYNQNNFYRENLLAYSNDLQSSRGWVHGCAGDLTLVGSDTGPYGDAAQQWKLGVSAADVGCFYRLTDKTETHQTITVIVKEGVSSSGFGCGFWINGAVAHRSWFSWSAGEPVHHRSDGDVEVSIVEIEGGWYRVSVHFAGGNNVGNSRLALFYPSLVGASSVGDDVWVSGVILTNTAEYAGYQKTDSSPVLLTKNYSTNAALAAADYRSNSIYGMGKTVDLASVGHAAAHCDRMVGSTPEKSREFGMLIDKRASNESWMQSLRAYAGCAVLNRGGTDYFLPEYKAAVSGTITASDIVEGSLKVQKRSLRNAPTLVRVHYTDTSKDPWVDHYAEAALPGVDTGAVPLRESNVRMSSIQRYSQAMREAVERLNLLNAADLDVSFRLRDEALKISEMDVIELTHPIGLTDQKLRITGKRTVETGRYEFRASEYFDGAYDDQIYTAPIYDSSDLPSVGDIPVITGLVVDEELFFSKDKTVSARLIATWDDTTYPYLHEYHVVVESASGDVLQDIYISGARFVSMALPEGEEYTVKVSIKSVIGIIGVAAVVVYLLLGKSAPPSDVPWINAEESDSGVVLTWGDVSDIDLDGYRVKRVYGPSAYWNIGTPVSGGGLVFSPLFIPAEEVEGQVTLMVKAVDTSGNESTSAAFVTLERTVSGLLTISATDIKSGGFSEYSTNTGVIDDVTGDLVATSDGSGGYNALVFDFLFTTPRPDPYYGIPDYQFFIDGEMAPAANIKYWDHFNSVMIGAGDLANYRQWPGIYKYGYIPGIGPDGWSTVVRIEIPAGATQGRISKLMLNRAVQILEKEYLQVACPAGQGAMLQAIPVGGTYVSKQIILQPDGGDAVRYEVTDGYAPNELIIKTYDSSGGFTDGTVDVMVKYY